MSEIVQSAQPAIVVNLLPVSEIPYEIPPEQLINVGISPALFRGQNGKSPYVAEDGYWYEFDDEAQEYRSTGIKADQAAAQEALAAAERAAAAAAEVEGMKSTAEQAAQSATEAAESAAQASQTAQGMIDDASAAVEAANAATEAANAAAQAATQAETDARDATAKAEAAAKSANDAAEAATSAATSASDAAAAANEAKQGVDETLESVNDALTRAEQTAADVGELQTETQALLTRASETAENVTGAVNAANTAASRANTSAELADQAAQRANQAAAGMGLHKQVTDKLPAIEQMAEDVIYLVPAEMPGGDSVYDEYLKIEGKAERIGSTAVDLSGYALKARNYSAVIPTEGWSGEGVSSVSIELSGITALDEPIVDVQLSGDPVGDEAILNAWALVTRIVTAQDEISVEAVGVPDVEIPIRLKVVN